MSRRVQEAITDDPARAEAMNHCWNPCALAGVFVAKDFVRRNTYQRDPRACALWDRVFARPAQTDAGWPKKVSRRVQEAITDDAARAEAVNHCWNPCALAAVRPKPSPPHRGKQNLPEHA